MSMTEAPYSITFKTPRGNLFTIRGNTAEELKANLNAAPKEGVLAVISEIENTLNPTQGVSGGRPASQAPSSAPRATAAGSTGQAGSDSQELPSGFGTPPCGTCGEPTRFDKEGKSSQSGKPYKRFLCTANALHKATFTNA